MAKVWVLDTETKGTGAEMVPLDKVVERKRHAPKRRERAVRPRRRASPVAEPADRDQGRRPRSYKLVNAITGEVVAERVGAQEIVERLERTRSIADARVYVWAPEADQWRALTLREQRLLREARKT